MVDSGSSNNFISEHLASYLPNWKPLQHPVKVKIADGKILLCTHEIPNCHWLVQGVAFKTTFKILPLRCHDAILGIDWLEQFSPMEVQWAEKWLSFLYQGRRVQLKGIPRSVSTCSVISEGQFAALQEQGNTYCEVILYQVEAQPESAIQMELPEQVQAMVNDIKICLLNHLVYHLKDHWTIIFLFCLVLNLSE